MDRPYTDAELDAAIEAITDPERLRHAESLVARNVPGLQRVLAAALSDGGWFESGHAQAVREATSDDDHQARINAVGLLLAEETRVGMLVGVAVGFELARELSEASPLERDPSEASTPERDPSQAASAATPPAGGPAARGSAPDDPQTQED